MEKGISDEEEDNDSSSDNENIPVGAREKKGEKGKKVSKKPAGLFYTKKLQSVTIGMVRKGKFHLNVATLMSEDEDDEENLNNGKSPSPESSPGLNKSTPPVKTIVSRLLGLQITETPVKSKEILTSEPHDGKTKIGVQKISATQISTPAKKVEFLIAQELSVEIIADNYPSRPPTPTKTQDTKDGSVDVKKKKDELPRGIGGSGGQDGSMPIRRTRPPKGHLLNEIRKMTLAAQDAIEEKRRRKRLANERATLRPTKKVRRVSKRKMRLEEEYTDKDRAAAVTFGYRDIKLSLREKRQRERKLRMSQDLLSCEQFASTMLVVEASFQMKTKKEAAAAIATLNKVLKLQPLHKEALVARSQCYLKLGDAASSLKDAETLLCVDETYIHGLFQFAESLYQLGEFEKALIAFHKGHRLRRDIEGFRIGIQKSQETIKRAIGDRSTTKVANLEQILPFIDKMGAEAKVEEVGKTVEKDGSVENNEEDDRKGESARKATCKSEARSRWVAREVLGQMFSDKEYFFKFLQRPDIQSEDYNSTAARDNATEALQYLESRQNFWRQQNPIYSRKTKHVPYAKF